MANSLLSINDLPQIPDIPHHPMGLTFPKRSFGEKKILSCDRFRLHGLRHPSRAITNVNEAVEHDRAGAEWTLLS